jgi:hypothetical protein
VFACKERLNCEDGKHVGLDPMGFSVYFPGQPLLGSRTGIRTGQHVVRIGVRVKAHLRGIRSARSE